MNTVSIRINSYAEQAKIYINGREPSLLAELVNYNYTQLIRTGRYTASCLA